MDTSVSFRSISKVIAIINIYFKFSFKAPSHTTTINWMNKLGYYILNKPIPIANDWIIILDHSIQLGNEKIFLVYGIQESKINFKKPLEFKDLRPLLLKTHKKTNGNVIKEEITELESKIGKIKYAVGDYGSDLKKGLSLCNIPHVHDFTHVIALTIEKIYKEDVHFVEYNKSMSNLRMQISQTEYAFLIPPKQRIKSRFHNIDTISKWGLKMLNYYDKELKNNKAIKDKVKWITKFKVLIKELNQLSHSIKDIQKIVKRNSLSKESIKKVNKILIKLDFEKGKVFKDKIQKYFNETMLLLPRTENILCTSDIIESAFGKYKNYVSSNIMAGVTNLILSFAAFTSDLSKEEIKDAFENVKMKDIFNWTKQHIDLTTFGKRKIMFNAT